MKTYYPVIGLEIHAELNTKSKMFCGCKNDPDETSPNVNICPICMAHPGTLPVPNRAAIESVIKVGLAVGADIADFTEFDRKNYFYPDIPKGYQISQYKYPIVSGGTLNGFGLTRIHLEEDTGLSKHLPAQAGDPKGFTLVDYNRAGVPLMELVTEPVIHTAKDAANMAKELQLLLRTLGVGEANLEKGEMRVEPNVSVSTEEGVFNTKVEIKNLNSFKSVEKAIEFEIARMIALYEAGRGDEIVQETRGWDEAKQSTFSQRSKENAHDYRYFPDPDLPKMKLHSAFDIAAMKNALPELPWNKRIRYSTAFGIKDADTELYVSDPTLSAYFESIVDGKDAVFAQLTSNYLSSDVLGLMKKDPEAKLPAKKHFVELITMVTNGEITSRGAKDILAIIVKNLDVGPQEIAEKEGLLQQNNEDALKPIITQVVAENEKSVADYKAGKEAALQALLGMIMKVTKGSANPSVAMKLLKELLQ